MITFKHIRTCADAEAVEITREHPQMFYSIPAAYERRSEETYRTCALAALEGLNVKAGHNFPSKDCNYAGWDAHRITARIFEEQTVFDPYADKTFCAEAMRLCCYYTLRYTDPDTLEKHSDFTLDQFAACFTSKAVLYLRKRGKDVSKACGISNDFQCEEKNGTFSYNIPDYKNMSYDYTQADVLRLINSDSIVKYDRIEIVD